MNKKSEKRVRTGTVMVRVTDEEKHIINCNAKDAGLKAPAFLRAVGMGRKTANTIDKQVINELRRLGGLQKHLFNNSGGAHSKEYSAILIEIKSVIQRIGGN